MALNMFNKNIKLLKFKLIKEPPKKQGYSILKSSKNIKTDNEILMEIAKECDEYGYISEELGIELDRQFQNSDYMIGIHRTGLTKMDDNMINSIFNKGLINNGDFMQGGTSGNRNIEKTVSFDNNFITFIRQLKVAHQYKFSEGCIIVKIPKSYLGISDGDIKPIYYLDNGITKLLPEFIYGYVPVDIEGNLGEIKHNPNYKDIHNINNVNLLYDDSAIDKAKSEGIKLYNQDISFDKKYEIIKKSYIETFIKYGKYQANQALLNLINNNQVEFFTSQENRNLLSKFVIYGDILKILCMSNLDLINSDINTIINIFIEDCISDLDKNNKLK